MEFTGQIFKVTTMSLNIEMVAGIQSIVTYQKEEQYCGSNLLQWNNDILSAVDIILLTVA